VGAVLRERRILGRIMLHLDPRNEYLALRASTAIGHALPARGCATGNEEVCILRLSPGTYLVVTPGNDPYALLGQIRAALADGHAAVIDLSSGYATFRLSGPTAVELLYRGCSVPLDDPDFVPGCCISTKFGKVMVIIHRVDPGQTFDLHVARSFALSLWDCIVDAGRGCGLLIAGHDGDRGPRH
jgi:sarcosine oxidase subunit gamma